jgi:hypothetical protein
VRLLSAQRWILAGVVLGVLLAAPSRASAQPHTYCSDVCTPSSSCEQPCYVSAGWQGTCNGYGVCEGYPPPGGGGGSCGSCNVYSRCDQQCVGGPPNPYNHTCSEYTQCGQCQGPTTQPYNVWNPNGNCASQVSNSYGDTCNLTGWNPGPTPYCAYSCQLPSCWNLR